MIGFSADGASVNLGKNTGVAAKLKEDAPWLIDIHCLAHRLELALLELQRYCAFGEKIYEVLHLTVVLKRNANEIRVNSTKTPHLRRNCGASCFWRNCGVPFVL